jgi:hypothetical protein
MTNTARIDSPVSEKPSILAQTEQIVASQPDGVRAGVIVQDADIGAEVSAKAEKGAWSLGAVARWTKGKGKQAAAYVGWTPK